jgi:hypothetical protein
LLFEPVLLQASQWSEARIGSVLFAAALFVIQVGTAVGAQAPAIAAADNLHRKREIYLLGEDVGQEQAVAFKESDFGVVQIEVKFLVL